jgi:hypothetical protein
LDAGAGGSSATQRSSPASRRSWGSRRWEELPAAERRSPRPPRQENPRAAERAAHGFPALGASTYGRPWHKTFGRRDPPSQAIVAFLLPCPGRDALSRTPYPPRCACAPGAPARRRRAAPPGPAGTAIELGELDGARHVLGFSTPGQHGFRADQSTVRKSEEPPAAPDERSLDTRRNQACSLTCLHSRHRLRKLMNSPAVEPRPPKNTGCDLIGCGLGIFLLVSGIPLFLLWSFDRTYRAFTEDSGSLFDEPTVWLSICAVLGFVAAGWYWFSPGPTPAEVALWEQRELERKAAEQQRERLAQQAAEAAAEARASARFPACPRCNCYVGGTKIYKCDCSTIFCDICGPCPRRNCDATSAPKWLGRVASIDPPKR